jgi:cell division protein FtsB
MKKKKKSAIGIFFLLAIFLYLSYIGVSQQKLLDSKVLELARLQDKIEYETKLHEELTKENETIQSDEYIEKIAREKLGMVKKNERVYVDIGK